MKLAYGGFIMKTKYFVVRNKAFADALGFITGQRYYVFNCKGDDNKKCYSFVRTNKLIYAWNEFLKIREEVKNI